MGTYYDAIKALETLNTLEDNEKNQITRILETLKSQRNSPSATILSEIAEKIQNLMQIHTTNNTHTNAFIYLWKRVVDKYTFIRSLQSVLDKVNEMRNILINYKDFRSGHRYDQLYSETRKTYHGVIVLPIKQSLDSRLALSKGECYGYS